jgi:hypothetical protein
MVHRPPAPSRKLASLRALIPAQRQFSPLGHLDRGLRSRPRPDRIVRNPSLVDRENASNSFSALDPLTIAAIGLLVGALADFIHEGLGHGGACLLVGGKPTLLTSMNFAWDGSGFPRWTFRVVAAGGTIANLLAGTLALAMLRRPPSAVHLHYFLWLFAAKPVCRYGLLLVLGGEQYWRLGKRHCRVAGKMALARAAGFARGRELLSLRQNDGGKSQPVNRRRPRDPLPPRQSPHADSLLRWRGNGCHCRRIKPASEGIAAYFGSRRFPGRHQRPGLGSPTAA